MKSKLSVRVILVLIITCLFSGCSVQKEPVPSSVGNESSSLAVTTKQQSEHTKDLLKDNEVPIISFTIVDSGDVVMLCESSLSDYIVFRYGQDDNIKLEFPKNLEGSWDNFKYSYYLRGGGAQNEALDLNYLSFQYDGSSYQIFQEFSSDGLSDVGLNVTNLSTNEVHIIQGDLKSVKGSLIPLRDNEKIEIEVQ